MNYTSLLFKISSEERRRTRIYDVRFQVLTVTIMNITFLDVAPCSLVEVDRVRLIIFRYDDGGSTHL
jgi:hypothetical protein